jgi:hypothetical protein
MTNPMSMPAPPPAPVPTFSTVPSPGTPIWVTVVTALCCLGLGLSVSLFFRGSQAAGSVQTVVSARVNASASVPTAPLDPLAPVAQGNRAAMDEVNSIAVEKRSIAQAVALSKGRVVEKHMALDLLRETLAQNVDGEGIKKLMQFAQDGDTVRTAIGIAASLPGEKGSDLLYELSTIKSTPPEMAILAGQFLNISEVRAKTSSALSLVLGLRDATTCEERKSLLEKAITDGDKRLVRHIVALTKKTGCGEKKNDDCHPCLRDDNQKIIRDALTKTQARKAPTF